MRVLHVAAEIFPVVRTGGLGDVVGALPAAQRSQGVDARVVLPAYPALKSALKDARLVASVGQHFGATQIDILYGTLLPSDVPLYAIDAPALFDRPGNPYLGPDGKDWPDNLERFALLGWAAAQIAAGAIDPDWDAEMLHAHDWHAGLAPAYLRLVPSGTASVRTVMTVHNLAYQGLFPAGSFGSLGLPETAFSPSGLEFWGQVSFMKAGLVYADRVTTVSPGYAREIATPDFGCGLDGVIASRGNAVSGILNGVDEEHWNPRTDPALAADFDVAMLDRRDANRRALIERFDLAPISGPLFGVVSRLTEQKGLDLLVGAMPVLLASGGALVLLGAGDTALEAAYADLASAYPAQIAVQLGYDDALSHQIMAGSDAVIVPSRFEPCGLTQLYALRYGAVPIVRRTGGLGDTVIDASAEALARGSATGVIFGPATVRAVAAAVERTTALFHQKPIWQAIQRRGMVSRFSWDVAAAEYDELYAAATI